MVKNIVNKWILKSAGDYQGQTYGDDFGEWKVPDLISYCVENKTLQEFEIDPLAQIAFQKSPGESYDEVPGSPAFIERAARSDLRYPIIVVRYGDGDFIADGNHRLWKAKYINNLSHIKGYLLPADELHQEIKPL